MEIKESNQENEAPPIEEPQKEEQPSSNIESNQNSEQKPEVPKKGEITDLIEYEILPENLMKPDVSFKLIVIGNSGVGKSCLSMQATKNIFYTENFSTVGFEYFDLTLRIKGKVIKLQIWDTCGQEEYRSLIRSFFKNASLALIVYSINDPQSFQDIELWLKQLRIDASPKIKVFLIGNKNDLESERKIPYEEGEKVAEAHGMNLFFETSAKTGFNALPVFIKAAEILFQEFEEYQKYCLKNGVGLSDKEDGKKKLNKKNNNQRKQEGGCC